jgi:succinate dehydrogenase flavin-adding protein (antitoxin of CptAB toxin-antitoxin module)
MRSGQPDWLIQEKKENVGVLEQELESEVDTWLKDEETGELVQERMNDLYEWLTKTTPTEDVTRLLLAEAITKYSDARQNFDKLKGILVWVKTKVIRAREGFVELDSPARRKR